MRTRTKHRQSRTAIESSIVKRRCPVCGQVARIEISEMSDGWEVWHCQTNGCRKDYRVR